MNWLLTPRSPPRAGWSARHYQRIVQMFEVIEQARAMASARSAIAMLSTGYLNALQYTKSRVQGCHPTQMTG